MWDGRGEGERHRIKTREEEVRREGGVERGKGIGSRLERKRRGDSDVRGERHRIKTREEEVRRIGRAGRGASDQD